MASRRWTAGLAAAGVLAGMAAGCRGALSPKDGAGANDEGRWLSAAGSIARWLEGAAVETPRGLAWRADPGGSGALESNLYSGSAGVVLFLIEYARVANDARALDTARRGADELARGLPTQLGGENAGLYTGAPGVAFVLNEAYRATRDVKYQKAASVVVDLLDRDAKHAGGGVEWNEYHDVVYGAAGTGLFLLYADREMGHPAALPLAKRAGARLVEVGIPDRGGVKWEMTPGNARNLPNFSHGTAGVAYYLTTLYRRTQDRRALNAALAGARYLTEAADRSDGGFRVFHADPDGLDRFYLGWCHGPPGTGRLFYQLWRATGGASWRDLYLSCARSVLTSGVPQAMNPGLWNNVGQCCGSAGIADFLLHASGVLGDNAYLAQAEALTRDLLARGVLDDRGLRFPQAEHRVKPDLVVAQTGFMQGAAGVGLWLLRLHGFATNRGTSVAFPDSPYED